MPDMLPITKIVMRALRWGSFACAGLMVLFAGLFIWQHQRPEGLVLAQQDKSFLGVVVFLFLVSLALAYAIGREMKKSGG